VALVIVLGLLSVLTILAVAFAVAMRVERLAARNAAHAVRAEHLTHVALVNAVKKINDSVAGSVYPEWTDKASEGGKNAPDLFDGEAARIIPSAIQPGAESSAKWIEISSDTGDGTVVHGRIAWHALNASGLLDPNYVGGSISKDRGYTNVCDMDISGLTEFNCDPPRFAEKRREDVRYETTADMGANGTFDTPSHCMYPYSLDIDRDQFFDDENPAALDAIGTEDAPNYLQTKFCVNSITNYTACYNDKPDLDKYDKSGKFMSEYYDKLEQLLDEAGLERPTDVAWNFINWLDQDRIPQSFDGDPWAHTEGGEGIPLFNEIVLEDHGGMPGAYKYKFLVELWFPFAPVEVEESDSFYLQLAAWDMPEPQGGAPSYSRNRKDFLNGGTTPTAQIDEPIEIMKFRTADEYLVYELDVEMREPLAETNCLWFLGRVVVKQGGEIYPVEQASGPAGRWKRPGGNWVNDRQYHPQSYTAPGSWCVDDPRSNGKRGDWQSHSRTLGEKLDNRPANIYEGAYNEGRCDPWSISPGNWRCGIPIYVKDGLMTTIGEVGYIYRSNVVPGQPGRWDTINLMHADKGAYLLDRMTVRDPEDPPATKGLVNLNTQHPEVLKALFYYMYVGYTDADHDTRAQINQDESLEKIAEAFLQRSKEEPFISFRDVFRGVNRNALDQGGPIALALRNAAVGSIPPSDGRVPSDKFLEDPFRQIVDMVSFRHNLFNIVCAAQVYAPEKHDGEYQVVAEKRALATVYRDSYTGHTFTRSFKWLGDDDD